MMSYETNIYLRGERGEFRLFNITMWVAVVYMNSHLIEKCETSHKQITYDWMMTEIAVFICLTFAFYYV